MDMKTDTKKRCLWAANADPLYQAYHDLEWGIPIHDDRKFFEFLTLEGAQAGLSWFTILKRREGYREAFANFDPKRVAQFDEAKISELMACANIIRNKLKIASCVRNAQQFLEIQREFGSFDAYIWRFVNGQPIINAWKEHKEVPCESEESRVISADLKKRGFTFVGPTIMYAFMQATGLVNDHTTDCFCYSKSM